MVQALEDMRCTDTGMSEHIADEKLDATMKFLDENGDGRINLQEFTRAIKLEESARKIIRRWRKAKTQENFAQILNYTRKWIDLPSKWQVQKFLYLTNGGTGEYNRMAKEDETHYDDGVLPIGRPAILNRMNSQVFSASWKSNKVAPGEGDEGCGGAVSGAGGKEQGAGKGALQQPLPWCGTFEALGDDSDVQYMTVNVPLGGDKEDFLNSYSPHLIRYYMEKVWKLKRPDVIITVTGWLEGFIKLLHLLGVEKVLEVRERLLRRVLTGLCEQPLACNRLVVFVYRWWSDVFFTQAGRWPST